MSLGNGQMLPDLFVADAPKGPGRSRPEINPLCPEGDPPSVPVRQGFRYPVLATFNGCRLVVFDAYEEDIAAPAVDEVYTRPGRW